MCWRGIFQNNNPEKMKKKSVTTKKFDKLFEEGKNITEFLDLKTARREGLEKRRVNVELPKWMIQKLDQQAMKLGVTRQSIIKFWISEKLKSA
jgi:hypothetical protein